MSFKQLWQQRFPYVALIIFLQLLYFPLNQKANVGVRLELSMIDGRMPLVGEFVVIYVAGIAFFCFGPFIMALILPRHLFQHYVLTHLTVMLTGFLFWMLIPAYVYKAPFVPRDQFEVWTQQLHVGDSDYGNQNAFPSSHVYYVTVLLFFVTKRWPRTWFICAVLSVLNAWSTMLTHQHYFADVVAGLFLTYWGIWMTYRVYLPKIAEWEQNQRVFVPNQNSRLATLMNMIEPPNGIADILGWNTSPFNRKAHKDNAQRIENKERTHHQ